MSSPVLIVDNRRDVLELNRILLEAEGYEAQGFSYAELTPRKLQDCVPDVLLLDLMPGSEEPWDLLRRLRQDPVTRHIRVVVTSDSPTLVEKVLHDRDLGIAAGLVMPFNIEALYAAIAAAAQPEVPGGIPVLARVPERESIIEGLREGRSRVVLRWIQRLSTLTSFRKKPTLSLLELRGHGDALFDTIVDALAVWTVPRAAADVRVAVRLDEAYGHATVRREQGVSMTDIVRELGYLRTEIAHELQARAQQGSLSSDEMWDLLRRLGNAVDETLVAIFDGWERGER